MSIKKVFFVWLALVVLGGIVSVLMWNVEIPVKGGTDVVPVNQGIKKDDLIVLNVPFENSVVSSPLTIMGTARGFWYFEASFPIELYDSNGNLLGTSIATAQDEWMTEDFVPFISTLTFSLPTTKTGTLVLKKDNPSGDKERDDSLSVQVRF